jgi:hypothetical protein
MRQLTTGGCCAGAWWAPDSSAVRYVDRENGADSSAIVGVSLLGANPQPEILANEDLEDALSEPLVVRSWGRYAMVEDVATGDKWPLPTDGKPVLLSPDGTRAVWWDTPRERVAADSLVGIYGSDIYGFDLVDLGSLWGAEVVGFLSDSRHVLVVGRRGRGTSARVLAAVNVDDGSRRDLAEGPWLSEVLLSPDGLWAVYSILLDRSDPEAPGIWVVPTTGGNPTKLPFIGSYRWRDTHRLAHIPMQPGLPAHELWETDVATGQARPLLDATAGLRVANNDWSISPDGHTLAFRSADDGNVWVVDLP